jgi:hypothetical protein
MPLFSISAPVGLRARLLTSPGWSASPSCLKLGVREVLHLFGRYPKSRTTLQAYKLDVVGKASAVKTREQGLSVAAGPEARQEAIGKDQTTIINAVKALAEGTQHFMPENLALTVGGEGGLGASIAALVPLLMRNLQDRAKPASPSHPHPDGETPPVEVQPAVLSRQHFSYKIG